MTSPALPYLPSKLAQNAILEFAKQASFIANQQIDFRENLRKIDLQYMREVDWTDDAIKAKMVAAQGDPTKFRNIVLPVIMPQVETAVTYQAEVFLSGTPIFGVVSQPGYENIALQMDSIILDQQIRMGWEHELTMAIRDGLKYNLMAVECDWHKIKSFTPETRNQKEVVWEGNRIKRLDLYNTFWDTRVQPTEVCNYGEFAGYVEIMSRIRLKKFIDSLPYNTNVTEAFESGVGNLISYGEGGYSNYYLPELNPDTFMDTKVWGQTDWMAWAGLSKKHSEINYKNMYVVTTLYGRIMPSEFSMRGIPGQNTPQVWKFIIVNNQVIIYAERLTNAHDLIPLFFAQPLNDGLSYQTKSFAQNVQPIQEINTALANSDIHSRRRALNDRLIYDATRISAAAMANDSVTAHIPARPTASGGIRDVVFPIPFNDSNFQINQALMNQYFGVADYITGNNPVRQGQFVKGNKTRREFETVMGNSTGRDRLMSKNLENTFFSKLKEVVKINILQFQPAGQVFNPVSESFVEIDPVALRQATMTFKLSDGKTPSERLIGGDVLSEAFQTIAQAPMIAQGYNVTPMFSYLMKSAGADLRPFEKSQNQVAYEQAVAQWQQAVAMIAEQVSKLPPEAISGGGLDKLMQQIPPQPLPEQFGYVPGKRNSEAMGVDPQSGNQLTLLQQTMKVANEQVKPGPPGESEGGSTNLAA